MALTKRWVINKHASNESAGDKQIVWYHPIDEKGNVVVGLSLNKIPEGEELVGEMVEDDEGKITIVPIVVTVLEGVDKEIENIPTKDLRSRLSFILKRLYGLEEAVMKVCDSETVKKIQAKQEELIRETK